MGEMVIGSKSHFKGVVDKDVKIRPISLKTWTKVEFSGQNDDNNRKNQRFYDNCIMGDFRWDVFKP